MITMLTALVFALAMLDALTEQVISLLQITVDTNFIYFKV